MKWLTAALAIGSKILDLMLGRQRAKERAEYREAGRQDQKVADLTAREGQASDANRIDEDVHRMSDDELNDSLPVRRTGPASSDG